MPGNLLTSSFVRKLVFPNHANDYKKIASFKFRPKDMDKITGFMDG